MLHNIKRRFGRMLAVMLALMLCGAPALAASMAVTINADTLVYQTASSSALSVGVAQGMRVTLKAIDKGWARVSWKGYTAYLPLKYIDRVTPLKAYTAEKAVVYGAPGEGRLGALSAGTAVFVLGLDGQYARVTNQSGDVRVYIKSSQLTGAKPEPAQAPGESVAGAAEAIPEALRAKSASKSNKVEYTIYVAQGLMGAPYAAKAKPPKTFDCAKLVHYCYGKAQSGCMKGTSEAQGNDDRYEKIAFDDLRRGDLVCFDTAEDGNPSDVVGIYLGEGYFIYASSNAGKVILSNLNTGYFNRVFSWGRRIFA